MSAFTKVSDKGQVVIPKEVRDRLRLSAGDRLEVIERSDGILLRKTTDKSGETFDEVTARIRAMVDYAGPPATIDEMTASVRAAATRYAEERDTRARR